MTNILTSDHRLVGMWRAPNANGDQGNLFSVDDVAEYLAQQTFMGRGVFNVMDPSYGAKGDGVTDDTAAILAAIAAAAAVGGATFFPPGTYLVSSSITENAAFPMFLEMAGRDGVTFKWNGAVGGKVFQFTKEGSQIRGGCVVAATNALIGNFIGLSHEASRQTCHDVRVVNANIGVQIDGRYGIHHYGLDVFQVQGTNARGLNLINGANSNILLCKQVTGMNVAGSVGIYLNGEDNEIVGNQLSAFDTNLRQTNGRGNRIGAFYNEAPVTYSAQVDAGVLYVTSNATGGSLNIADGARLVTMTGGYAPGIPAQANHEIPTRGLTAYYALQEGSGTAILDTSGNKNHATASGVTWTTGPFGQAAQIDGTHIITLPNATVTYNQPWTVALLVRLTVAAGSNQSIVWDLRDASGNKIQFLIQAGTSNIIVNRNGSFAGNISIPVYALNQWVWVIASYDGSATVTSRDPYNLGGIGLAGQTVALANPLTVATNNVVVHNTNTNGTIQYGSIAVWNREVGADEMLAWVNMRHVILPPTTRLPFTGTLTLSTSSATTTVTDKAVTAASHIEWSPTSAAAAGVEMGTQKLYVSARTAGTSFALTTQDGTNAAAGATFTYSILG